MKTNGTPIQKIHRAVANREAALGELTHGSLTQGPRGPQRHLKNAQNLGVKDPLANLKASARGEGPAERLSKTEAGESHLCTLLLSCKSQWHLFSPVSMGTIFTLSLCQAPGYQYLPEVGFYTHLVPQFLWMPSRECPFITWLRWRRRRAFLGPKDHHNWHSPRDCQPQSTTKTADMPPVFLRKSLYACPGVLDQGADFRFGTHLEAQKTDLGEYRPGDAIFTLSLCLATAHQLSPKKELIHSARAPIFVTVTQGIPPDQPALVANKVYAYGLPELYIFASFKSC